MKSRTLVLVGLAVAIGAGCSERAPESTANQTGKIAETGSKVAPLATSLQITVSPETKHTVGKFDPAANAMIAEKGQTGMLMFGPYVPLAPGHYQATFRITAEAGTDGTEVGVVDINGFTGANSPPPLAVVPLKATRGEQTIKLTFEAANPAAHYEFRVYVNGKGNRLSIRDVRVEKL